MNKKKNNLVLLIIIILILAIIFFVFLPLFKEIKENSNDLVSQKEKLNSFQLKIENIENFKRFYEENKEDLEKIEKIFINSNMPTEFIGFLENNARDCQAEIKISPSAVKQSGEDKWPALAFQLSLTSSPANALKFLQRIEENPYLVEVQSLSFNKKTDTGQVSTNLTIKVFTE